ncbi:MAG: DMT family transporter [Eubacteriales bacterium]|nr:DMT family transporter [Eubacteriales bacterium]
MTQGNKARLMVVVSMLIFGTIGVFVKFIPLPSSVIAFARSVIGTLFLLIVSVVSKNKPSFSAIKKNLPILLALGTFLGANWILLFEAYRYTTVAVATLCYYLAPVFVVLVSPLVLGEKLTLKKFIFSVIALFGMILVSGVVGGENTVSVTGMLFGVGAAVLYASIILLNKKLKDISANDTTIAQLGISAVVVGIYVFFTEDFSAMSLTGKEAVLLVIVGIVHTGIAYALYFGAVKSLKAQTAAIFSYIDPVFAIILSALFLSEPMTVIATVGAVLILGSTLVSELTDK